MHSEINRYALWVLLLIPNWRKIVFGRSRKSPHTVGTFSGVLESLPTSPARFRAFPKISRHRWHVFGRSRKSPDIAGAVSGHPEEQKTKNGAFASFRFLLFHLFTFSPFQPFTFSPLSRGMYLSADSVKRLKGAFGNKSICAMGIISYPELA